MGGVVYYWEQQVNGVLGKGASLGLSFDVFWKSQA